MTQLIMGQTARASSGEVDRGSSADTDGTAQPPSNVAVELASGLEQPLGRSRHDPAEERRSPPHVEPGIGVSARRS